MGNAAPAPAKPPTPGQAVVANPNPAEGVQKTFTHALAPGMQSALANPVAGVGELAERPVGAYVAAAHPRANNWPTLQSAGIAEGDWYFDGCGELRKCMPLKYWLFAVTAFGSNLDPTGNVLNATEKPELIANPAQLKAAGLQEHFVSVILVNLGDKILPAKCDFRGTKADGAKVPVAELRKASDPNWPSSSDAAKVAAQFPHPFGRVYFTANTVKGVVKGGTNKGLPYHAARVTGLPTPVGDMEKLLSAMQEVGFTDLMNQAWANYENRCQQIRAAVPK